MSSDGPVTELSDTPVEGESGAAEIIAAVAARIRRCAAEMQVEHINLEAIAPRTQGHCHRISIELLAHIHFAMLYK